MELDIGHTVAILDFEVGTMIVILSLILTWRLRGGTLAYVSTLFLMCGILYIVHAGVEILGLGEELYALSALVTTLLLGFCMIILEITTRMLRGKHG